MLNHPEIIVSLLLEVIGIVAVGVWAVGKIRTTGAVLRTSIDALVSTIQKIDAKLDNHENKLDNHGDRLARLEERVENHVGACPPHREGRLGQ